MTKLFISYSRVDLEFTERLVERLRRVYGLPNVWYDDELHGGARWWESILQQIAACDVFIYLLSNESVTSPYCQAEFAEAQRLQKPVVTVQIRDKTRLSDALREIHYVDLKRGLDDDGLARLIRALNEQAALPKKKRALWTPATPMPVIPTSEDTKTAARADVETPTLQINRPSNVSTGDRTVARATIIAAIIGGIFAVSAVVVGGILPQIINTPTAAPTIMPTSAAAMPTDTTAPTEALTATPQPPTDTPTPNEVEREATLQAVMLNLQTEQALLQATSDVATAVALTATANAWTDTPTPDDRATASALLTTTAEQYARDQTATANAWTDTPTPTLPATATPPPTADPLQAALERARTFSGGNTDWQPFLWTFDDGVEMALVPAGCFMMGSTDEQLDYARSLGGSDTYILDEQPVHQQCFDEPFWVDRTEVTNADFAAFLNSSGNGSAEGVEYLDSDDADVRIAENGGQWMAQSEFANHPVIEVTWYGARDFCASRRRRLPTEREWEYAARGPESWNFPWGNIFDGTLSNFCDSNCGESWADGTVDDGFAGTAPVGSYDGGESWVGAYDLSGNVWEWVSTVFDQEQFPYPYKPNDGRENINSSEVRVLRGGSFDYASYNLRAANRGGGYPDGGYGNWGFRCALSNNSES